jgi:aryl-alcohol dehydrogenase-like predicted oxidoreductase
MRNRTLGSTDIEVSEIGLGSWLAYGGGAPRPHSETSIAKACLDRAFDVGINFLDTANIYGYGRGEEFLGEALQKRPRDSYVLATKLCLPMSETDKGLSREQIFKQIDASLARLRTDYVDLYQCHRYDWETPLEETMEALTEVVRGGKARYLGFSEWPPEKVKEALEIWGVEKFVSSQPQYSMLWRGPELEVIPVCKANAISQIVWSPLAQGVLTGIYRPGEPAPQGSRRASVEMNSMMENFLGETILERVQKLRPIALELGISMAQLALAWVLTEPSVASAITSATRLEQVEDNAGASGIELDGETLRRIDGVLGGCVVYKVPAS